MFEGVQGHEELSRDSPPMNKNGKIKVGSLEKSSVSCFSFDQILRLFGLNKISKYFKTKEPNYTFASLDWFGGS